MTEKDILCRASAFAVDGGDGDFLFLTVLHAVRPFMFPQYYPDEWLRYVRPEHVTTQAEYRDPEGQILATVELGPAVYPHPNGRDVAIMRLLDPEGARVTLEAAGVEIEPATFAPTAPANGQPFTCVGHVLSTDSADHPDCLSLPMTTMGAVRVNLNTFYKPAEDGTPVHLSIGPTQDELHMGMCGGPALTMNGEALGMLEGMVAENTESDAADKPTAVDELERNAAIIPAQTDLLEFIDLVREGLVDPDIPSGDTDASDAAQTHSE